MKKQCFVMAALALAVVQVCSAQVGDGIAGETKAIPESGTVPAPAPAPAPTSTSTSTSPDVEGATKGGGPRIDRADTSTPGRIAAEAPISTKPRLIEGNDQVFAAPKPMPPLKGASMAFRFEEAPITEVVHLVMKDLLQADYVIYPPLVGSVTLATQSDVTPDQAVLLLESALQANGLTMVRDPHGTYHIGKTEALRGIVPGIRLASPLAPLPPGSGPIIVPLNYIGATEMAQILRPMLPGDALLRVDNVRNLLILAGNRTQAEGWLDIVATFDVSLLKGMSVGLFPLRYASTKDVESAMRLFGGGGAAAAASAGSAASGGGAPAGMATGSTTGGPGASSGASAASAESFPLFGAVRIMPIERLNSVLVVSPRKAYLEEAREWIERLDQPGGSSNEAQLYVYPVQNGSAKHLAGVIGSLFGGQTSGSGGAQGTGVAPSLTSATQTTGTLGAFTSSGLGTSIGTAGSAFSGLGSSLSTQQRTNTQAQNTQATAFTVGGVRIIADTLNNAVLVWGTRSDFVKIESTLKRLDIAPVQVLIEASIIEVTLNDQLSYGLQWAFSNGLKGGNTGNGLLTTGTAGAIASAGAGFSYTVLNSAGNVRAVLNALAGKTNLKVISSPSLMVLDNNTASITVGTQQPIQAATTIVTGGIVSNSIQYKDTGVSLMVTPSVTAGDMVTMELTQSVTDVGATQDLATSQYPFQQRQITSKVAVRSGQNVVLGGLISDKSSTGSSGLPGLSSIPVLGGLFGQRNSSSARTELLVVLTPRVVRSDQDVRDTSEELRDRMKGFIGFDSGLPRNSPPKRVSEPAP